MLSRAFRRGLCHSLPIRAAAHGTNSHGAKEIAKKDDHHDDHHHDDHHHDHHDYDQPEIYSETPVDKSSMSFWNYRPDFAHIAPWMVTHEMDTNERVKRGYYELITPHYHMGRLYSKDPHHAVAPTLTENVIHGMLPWSYARLFFWLLAIPIITSWALDNEFPGFFATRMVRWWLGLGEYNWTKFHEMAVNEGFIQEDDEPDYSGVFDWYYKRQWKAQREGK